jgi:hypothetical protein
MFRSLMRRRGVGWFTSRRRADGRSQGWVLWPAVARREQGLLVEQGDDITVGTTFAKETTGAAIAGRAGRGTGLFTHTPTFATHKTTFGVRGVVKLN